jgi:hypothetical protein
MKQESLAFMPRSVKGSGSVAELIKIGIQRRVEMAKKPDRVWTVLVQEPEIPFEPVHFENAFLEDYVHDWDWRNGWFRYYGCARGEHEDVTIFVEYADG